LCLLLLAPLLSRPTYTAAVPVHLYIYLQAALTDLEHAQDLDAWDEEIPALRLRVLAAQRAAEQNVDKQLAAKMLGR
jgi:hypothetical protein